jgi:maltose-binding protein MalE
VEKRKFFPCRDLIPGRQPLTRRHTDWGIPALSIIITVHNFENTTAELYSLYSQRTVTFWEVIQYSYKYVPAVNKFMKSAVIRVAVRRESET